MATLDGMSQPPTLNLRPALFDMAHTKLLPTFYEYVSLILKNLWLGSLSSDMI